jgi:2-C-methyl-D-erythritol 4-phosphate cytidylyltransferase
MSARAAVTAVIAAAGSGERLGAGGPKAFVPLAGRPLVEWSLAAMRAAGSVRSLVVACPPGHQHDLGEDLVVVDGGATRAQSVLNALAAVATELVAIHDAARPLLTPELLEGVVATLVADPGAAGAIAAAPVTDTIKRATPSRGSLRTHTVRKELRDEGGEAQGSLRTDEARKEPREVGGTVDRNSLWAAQTPQVFRTAALREALEVPEEARDAATDEAMLVESRGGRVLIHPSSPGNLKVTTPIDLRLAELLLAQQ